MLIGKKIGMTQIFADNGQIVPVTVIKAGPLRVVGLRTIEKDGYNSVIVGFGEKKKNVNKPYGGLFKKANIPPAEKIVEFRTDDVSNYKIGSEISVDTFKIGDSVDVIGWTKGRGFQGVVKRWRFHGGPSGHGSRFHRIPGSIGMHSDPGRVLKGQKMPGKMGNERKTIRNAKIALIDKENHIIGIKGAAPVTRNSWILIKGKKK
ncbi:50S ribosomal protein L3 [candidate division WOR-3 bacterium]|nr:50S ribosomal protein L3 [candidate division WOR-3 bacterium]